ncbi:MAG: amidohydrolase family protein, partial [Acidimicrobiia bacterium]
MTATGGRLDVHHHVLPPAYVDALSATGVGARSGIGFPDWRLADSLAVMDRHGIAAAALSVSTPGVALADEAANRRLARRCNEWAADAVREHPGRFGAFASLPLPDVDGSLAEVAHALDDLGLDGVVLLASHQGRYLGDAAFEPLMAELDRRRAVAFIHPTTPPGAPPAGVDVPVFAVEFVADTTRAVANLIFSGTLERYPGISFVVAHAGGFAPYIAARLQ